MEQDKNNFPWPRQGDDLLAPNEDWKSNACFHFSQNPWGLYSDGFREAAEMLAQHVIINGTDQDTLVYPILFLYRHHIELKLKEIIQKGSLFLGEPKKIRTTHRLEELWKDSKEIMIQICPEAPIEDFNNFESCLNQLVQLDGSSMTFRYPEHKEKQSLSGISRINIRNMSQVMAAQCNFLEGFSDHIDSLKDNWDEMCANIDFSND